MSVEVFQKGGGGFSEVTFRCVLKFCRTLSKELGIKSQMETKTEQKQMEG